jgi:CBS domain containing-hemolysin-like protein
VLADYFEQYARLQEQARTIHIFDPIDLPQCICRHKIMKNRICISGILVVGLMLAQPAQASLFEGETLDAVANAVSWVALIIVPITLISLFWLVHIMPEKIAEKKKHPQAKAIQVLCLLSLVFGGLLWPIAFIWAYSKPVIYKLAYGTDTLEHEPSRQETAQTHISPSEPAAIGEVESLRSKVATLEAQLAQRSTTR